MYYNGLPITLKFGYASAIGVVLLVLCAAVIWLVNHLIRVDKWNTRRWRDDSKKKNLTGNCLFVNGRLRCDVSVSDGLADPRFL